MKEKHKPIFKVGDRVRFRNEVFEIVSNADIYILKSERANSSTPVIHVDFGNEDYELSLVKREEDPDLNEFEAELFTTFSDIWQSYLVGEEVNVAEVVKEHSPELLERAKKVLAKDMPKWKPASQSYLSDRLPRFDYILKRVVARDENGAYYLTMDDLYKLPKED